jgi:hypothetical protein
MLIPLCVGVLLPRSSRSHLTNEGRFECLEFGLGIVGLSNEVEDAASIE